MNLKQVAALWRPVELDESIVRENTLVAYADTDEKEIDAVKEYNRRMLLLFNRMQRVRGIEAAFLTANFISLVTIFMFSGIGGVARVPLTAAVFGVYLATVVFGAMLHKKYLLCTLASALPLILIIYEGGFLIFGAVTVFNAAMLFWYGSENQWLKRQQDYPRFRQISIIYRRQAKSDFAGSEPQNPPANR